MKHKSENNTSENGNVIIFVFIAVILLAALTFAFTDSNRGGQNVISQAQADAYANQMIGYANDVKQAVKRLSLRGCADNEISFENDNLSALYINPNSPDDFSCHVFHINGAGLQLYTHPFETNPPTSIGHVVFKNFDIQDAGTTTADLVLGMFVTESIAESLANLLNISTIDTYTRTPVRHSPSGLDPSRFGGSFTPSNGLTLPVEGSCNVYFVQEDLSGTSAHHQFFCLLQER